MSGHGETPFEGWRSRGYLPHVDNPELIQFVTFRLFDAVPGELAKRVEAIRRMSVPGKPEVSYASEVNRVLDANAGLCRLSRPEIAEIVQDTLLHFDAERYRLYSWCIMPNHVHCLVEALSDWTLSKIVHSWKSFTAKAANRILDRTGEFWYREYYDRFIRSSEQFDRVKDYIELNPVKAKLCADKQDWRWSSCCRCDT